MSFQPETIKIEKKENGVLTPLGEYIVSPASATATTPSRHPSSAPRRDRGPTPLRVATAETAPTLPATTAPDDITVTYDLDDAVQSQHDPTGAKKSRENEETEIFQQLGIRFKVNEISEAGSFFRAKKTRWQISIDEVDESVLLTRLSSKRLDCRNAVDIIVRPDVCVGALKKGYILTEIGRTQLSELTGLKQEAMRDLIIRYIKNSSELKFKKPSAPAADRAAVVDSALTASNAATSFSSTASIVAGAMRGGDDKRSRARRTKRRSRAGGKRSRARRTKNKRSKSRRRG